jgi:hypothetical protein
MAVLPFPAGDQSDDRVIKINTAIVHPPLFGMSVLFAPGAFSRTLLDSPDGPRYLLENCFNEIF